jgi:hypothetical protein
MSPYKRAVESGVLFTKLGSTFFGRTCMHPSLDNLNNAGTRFIPHVTPPPLGSETELRTDTVAAFPFPRDTIKGWIQEKVWRITGQWIDPDKVYLHQFSAADSTHSTLAVTGWEHHGVPEKSMTLTEAVTTDFLSAERYGAAGKAQAVAHFVASNVSPFSLFHSDSVTDFFNRLGRFLLDRTGPGYLYSKIHDDVPNARETWRDLDSAYGLYLSGPHKGIYNADNQLRLKPSELLNLVREGDLQKKVTAKLDDFWSTHGGQWRSLAKKQFVMEAHSARALGQKEPGQGLSAQEYARIMRAAAPDVPLQGGAEAEPALAADSKVMAFDINGYRASDILRFVSEEGGEVLYMPGEKPALLPFKNRAAVDQWVLEQSKDPAKAVALEQHFSLLDRQQGIFGPLSANGVDGSLKKLGSGEMAANDSHINTLNYPIAGDVFSFMASQARQRISADANTEMTSNSEVYKADALGMLQAGNAVFSIPLALLGPIGLALGAASYGAQVGLEIDKAVEGDTQAERANGLHQAATDVATMAFFHALGKAGPATQAPAAADAPAEVTNPGVSKPFFNYRRVNGQVGVLMSPPSAPRLPALNPHWDPSMEVYLQPGARPPRVRPGSEVVPGIAAKRPRVDDSDDEASSPSSVASNASSSAEYTPYDDARVLKVNDFKANVTLPPGGYFNSRGMIERTDLLKLYRVEKAQRVERRGDPEDDGFRNSNFFDGPEKMMDGDVVVASRSKEAAMYFGDTEFDGNYHLYEIDSRGIPAVSSNENIDANPQFVEARQGVAPGTLEVLRHDDRLEEFAASSYKFDEVHLANNQLSPDRITRISHG